MKKRLFFSALAIASIALLSCNKEASVSSASEESTSTATTTESALTSTQSVALSTAVSSQLSDLSSEDVQSVSVQKYDGSDTTVKVRGSKPARDSKGHYKTHGSLSFEDPNVTTCATVTTSGTSYPKVIVIDYGTGCTSASSTHVKKGKITISISDSLVVAGAVKTVTYENFYIDSIQIEKTATIKNLGQNDAGHWLIVSTSTEKMIKPSGKYHLETKTDSIEWIAGFETATKSDDIYYKSGTGVITVSDTLVYSKKITKPLLVDKSCKYILSGTIVLNRKGTVVVIDYGDGTCDSTATVTLSDGTVETIDLSTSKYGTIESTSSKGSKGKKH